MERQEHLLTIIIEECDEISQRATKALRFGLTEKQKDQDFTNAQRLVYEFNDLIAVMKMMEREGLLPEIYNGSMQNLKIDKIEQYLKYSSECGTLNNNNVEQDRDSFAINFAAWYAHAEDAAIYRSQHLTAYELLKLYKSRPFLRTDAPESN